MSGTTRARGRSTAAGRRPASGRALAGGAFGVVAFFSVFIFLFRGRSATFVGLVNRLVSLVAGTAATLLSALLLGGAWPAMTDWVSLGFILVAVAFLARAEQRTVAMRKAA